MFGPEKGQQHEVTILNRFVLWDGARGLVYEAGFRHAEVEFEQLRLQEVRKVTAPGAREEGRLINDNELKFTEDDATKYRVIVARLNYLSPGSPRHCVCGPAVSKGNAQPNEWCLVGI